MKKSKKASAGDHPYLIGKLYQIRTVTMIYTGRIIAVYPQELVLDQAAWIPQTERWSESVKTGVYREVEMYMKPVGVGRGSIVDFTQMDKIPTESK
jgi:hypothetical protein